MFWRLKLQNKTGARAEALALDFLKRKRLKLVACNYACKSGELDLVMLDNNILVFIEVRSRTPSHFGTAADSITPGKQQRIRKAAAHFLQHHRRYQSHHCRFDAILVSNKSDTVTCNNDERQPKPIEWLQGIF